MKIETFELERRQSLWENLVKYNLTESGVHPYSLDELLSDEEITQLLSLRLGYGQTNGSIELRETIAQYYTDANMDNFLVTNGSAEANFIGIWSNLEPGDELVLMLPNYMQIWGLARSFGIKVKPFYLKEDHDWQPDVDELEKVVSAETKMIAVCNPNNPTGAVLNERAMENIVELAREIDAWIYSDEVYRGVELKGEETASFWGLYDKVMVTGGLSKAYALPGLRIGWLAGPRETIAKAWSYHDYMTIAPSIISDRVATKVLQPATRRVILERNKSYLKENLAVLSDWVRERGDLFEFVPPKAGGMVFLRYSMSINSTVLTDRLKDEKSVLIAAGDCFGMDNYIRIGIGSEKENFLAGLDLLDELLREISETGHLGESHDN